MQRKILMCLRWSYLSLKSRKKDHNDRQMINKKQNNLYQIVNYQYFQDYLFVGGIIIFFSFLFIYYSYFTKSSAKESLNRIEFLNNFRSIYIYTL